MTSPPGPIPPDVVSLADYERYFMRHRDVAIRTYISAGAGDGLTMADNRRAFDRLRLMPRMLACMEGANTKVSFLGHDYTHPVFIAPCAYHRLVNDDGELATATAAMLTQTCMTVSTLSSVRLEDIARASASRGAAAHRSGASSICRNVGKRHYRSCAGLKRPATRLSF